MVSRFWVLLHCGQLPKDELSMVSLIQSRLLVRVYLLQALLKLTNSIADIYTVFMPIYIFPRVTLARFLKKASQLITAPEIVASLSTMTLFLIMMILKITITMGIPSTNLLIVPIWFLAYLNHKDIINLIILAQLHTINLALLVLSTLPNGRGPGNGWRSYLVTNILMRVLSMNYAMLWRKLLLLLYFAIGSRHELSSLNNF